MQIDVQEHHGAAMLPRLKTSDKSSLSRQAVCEAAFCQCVGPRTYLKASMLFDWSAALIEFPALLPQSRPLLATVALMLHTTGPGVCDKVGVSLLAHTQAR